MWEFSVLRLRWVRLLWEGLVTAGMEKEAWDVLGKESK